MGAKHLFFLKCHHKKPKERKPPLETTAASPADTELDPPPPEVVPVEASPVGKLLPDNQEGLTPSPPNDAINEDDPMRTPFYQPPEAEVAQEQPPLGPEDLNTIPEANGVEDTFEDEEPPIPPTMLSKAAADARLRRACAPNSKGEYKVPPEVVDAYADAKEGRINLMKLFEKCAHDPDWVGERNESFWAPAVFFL